jgi:hypothetical protein
MVSVLEGRVVGGHLVVVELPDEERLDPGRVALDERGPGEVGLGDVEVGRLEVLELDKRGLGRRVQMPTLA